MNTTMMLAPVALAMGLAAAPSSANGAISVAVPAIVVDVNGVLVSVGAPPPPPPVVVVYEPAPEYVVVHEHYYPPPPPRNVVVVHERHDHGYGYGRDTRVVYVEEGRFGRDHGACRGHDGRYREEHVRHHGGWERQVKHHGGHDDKGHKGHGKGHGHDKHAKYRR